MDKLTRDPAVDGSAEVEARLIEIARSEAARVLRNCIHRRGFMASSKAGGYPQVWARDSMITLLGALASGDDRIVRAAYASADTLRRHQTPLGLIPNYVDTRNGRPSYHIYADGGAWYVIGQAALFAHDGDLKRLREVWPSVEATLRWYEYQDVDRSDLVSMQEATGWEDLLATRGKGLYVNLLHYAALRKAVALARRLGKDKLARQYSARASAAKRAMNSRLWYEGDPDDKEKIYRMYHGPWRSEVERKHFLETVNRRAMPENDKLPEERYYLPYVTHYDFGEWFDSLGNLLAVLTGVADRARTDDVMELIEDHGLTERGPVVAVYPSIRPGDSDWRDYYANFNLNLPDQYHNGGIWPFVGGFYVAALVKSGRRDGAQAQLAALAELNRRGRDAEWEFNEWHHGKSGSPMGMAEQAWSAGMFLYADECVRRGRVSFL